VTVNNLSERVVVRHLNETNAERALHSPENYRAEAGETLETRDGKLVLNLLPYAVARIDSV
jgi:hypothetical protein